MMAESDAERISPMGDDEGGGSEVKRPTRVPSIKIEPPCEFTDSTSLPQSAMTITTTSGTGIYSALSPSMSPNHHAMVDLRNQPGNYKKNLTARFLQQGHSEDDGYYRSDTDCDMLQPDEKRSKSLDRGLEYDPCDTQQPLDLSTSFYKPASGRDYHNKFEERARKMHRRQRAESEENLTDLSHFSAEHLLTMQRLSRSDFQLDRIQHSQPSRQSTPSSCPAESDVPSATDSPDQTNSGSAMSSKKNMMSLPPISMVYNRGTSSSSTDGSLDMDRVSPFNQYPPSTLTTGSVNPALAASVYENIIESGSMLPLQGMPLNNFNMSAFLQWHQMQSRMNNTATNQCFICKQTFPGFDNMAKHIAKHLPTEVKTDNNNRVHVCKVCNRSFSRSDMLTRHMRLHTGLKPYECKECGQVFSRSDHLNTHKRTHTGEKPYQCPKCPYAACRRDMITRHMRIHTSKVTDKKRRKLGMLYPKDSVSGSSMESTDSTPSRGGSLSGNSFDSSFDTAELRWPQQRHLLDPGDLMRNQTNRSNWSASNSFDSSDFRSSRGDAWSFLASADSTESESHPHGASFEADSISSPPKTSSPAVFSVPVMQLTNHDRPFSSAKSSRPSLVRQDASLDHDSNRAGLASEKGQNIPFSDYKTKLEYRSSSEGRLMECSDEIDVSGIEKDSVGNVDSPRTVESPLPSQETMISNSRGLRADYLPKQASLSDELNLQKCALNE